MMDSTSLWIVLAATVAVALILDLFVFHRNAKEIPPR